MTCIRMSSDMGNRFGRNLNLNLDTNTPAEAFRALQAVLPGFKKYLADAHKRGITFAVFRGRGKSEENIGRAQMKEPAGDTIRIAPILAGSKAAGLFQTILGIVLIAVSIFDDGLTAPEGAALLSAGIGLTAGGIIQMLSPQARLGKNADSADNQASYVFSGPVNTTAEGNPVPVCYGRMLVGSAVISAGTESDEYTPAAAGVTTGTPNGNSKSSPYDIAV